MKGLGWPHWAQAAEASWGGHWVWALSGAWLDGQAQAAKLSEGR